MNATMSGLTSSRSEHVEQVLNQVISARRIVVPESAPFEFKNCISPAQGEWLANLVTKYRPQRTLETGMGTGLSGSFFCLGLLKAAEANPNVACGRHTAIDPGQTNSFWRGAGLALRDQAGLTDIFEWIGRPSEYALPQMVEANETIDLAFIDAHHRFESALVEFYYIDRLLPKGGICIIDDTDWPSVWRVVQFALQHRNYTWVDALSIDQGPLTRPWGWNLRYRRWKQFRSQGWSGWEALTRRPYQAVALQKTGQDPRPEDFWSELRA